MKEDATQEDDKSNSQSLGRLWSETDMLVYHIYTSGKAWQIETDNSCNDGETFEITSLMVPKHTHLQL